jgi:hypothetical protein
MRAREPLTMRSWIQWVLALLPACAPGRGEGPALGVAPRAATAQRVEEAPDQAVELGRVHWERDHDAAFTRAARDEKPVLLLFQEVPG